MSYQVIARKWRPQTFEEVTGQEVITQTLRNALEYDRLHHAYLFSGARGVGKTTTARILAKALNCHKTEGKPNLTPCLLDDPTACPSCIEISESRSMDVLEIDAASHTGIDDVRGTIIEGINFNPARDRYKVFIIDEVHQLSKPAFNALLKTLEEPPSNVVFVMATTELHKVPETILSRCQEFEFRTIAIGKIFDRLKLIATAEKIDISDEALREIARSGEGSMRDAQSNFDQVISFSGESISVVDVTNALGFAGVEVLSKAMSAISERQPKAALEVVDNLISRGHDMRNFCRDLLGLFRDLLVYKVSGGDESLYEGAVFSTTELATLAEPFSESDLLRFFNSLAETEASLREAVHPRYVLEIGLVKLIEMRKLASIEGILERLDALASGGIQATPQTTAKAVEEKKTLVSEKVVSTTPTPTKPEIVETQVAAPVVEQKREIPPREYFPPDDDEPIYEESPFSAAEIFEPEPEYSNETFADSPAESPGHVVPGTDKSASDFAKSSSPIGFQPPALRLAPIAAEDLEHFDDKRLDEWFEDKLSIIGDDAMPIPGAAGLVRQLIGEPQVKPKYYPETRNGNGTAAAPAFDVAKLKAELSPEEAPVELPVLGADPTPEELMNYANAHPAVRAAKRIFRGKVIEVSKA
jgi:DNA polymerase-3 subunit gamma/tau